METDPLEILLLIIAALANLISHSCLELVAEEMSQGSRTPNVSWSRPEEHNLLSFLISQKLDGRMGDGLFRHSTWTAAAAHMVVVTQPPPATIKTAKSCKGKYGTFKTTYRVINEWRRLSGVHWDNENGANIVGAYAEKVWADFLKAKGTGMLAFKKKGWPFYSAMETLLLNDFARGSCAYNPTAATTTGNAGIVQAPPHLPASRLLPSLPQEMLECKPPLSCQRLCRNERLWLYAGTP
ncbi:hypothetical protein SCLCIDRAFT_32832 [Scleroderma citrinum Foug A]|uniref:Myb/SANT-like domain-containing protein n=1 Tax=Scleroderma citrinum Foug A TaxID=1036808 RepID=A0A0C3CUJ1_9AGAM|nr:hypothetical protein SCLCIDRAFT_32832 [Scleroderma citrinum Foug A]